MEGVMSSQEDTNVRVAVRCRPLNEREKGMSDMTKCVSISSQQLVIRSPAGEDHTFAFDLLFDENSTQPQVWSSIGMPILEKAFSGYNGTIFAYGQTGSGKTWSMQGADGNLQGVIPRMNSSVFERIAREKASNPNLQFLVTASYFELYNEVIFDLLDPSDRKKRSKSGLEIKEHPVLGVYVKGLQEMVVDSPKKMQDIIDQGMRSRTTASTQMNADSSRSHSVFTIKIHQKDTEEESKNLFAKVNLVDLAGSERVKSTGATGATLKEGANINKSLSALGNVINALVEQAKGKKGAFVPYRNSKLTRVLQESLGGNSITVMIAALSPALCNFEETLSTLKYANRAKAIKVRAVKNDESSQVNRLNEEIKLLKEKLLSQNNSVDTSLLEAKHQQQLRDLEEAMRSTWEDKARISAEHERERIRLEQEQQEAQRKLKQQREDNWRLLEKKADIDLSISHLRDMLRAVHPDAGGSLGSWASDLRDVLRLEGELSEQFTIVEVYRGALHRDGEALVEGAGKDKDRGPGAVADRMAVGMWKQLRDKFQALHTETGKWVKIQGRLMAAIGSFLESVRTAQRQWEDSKSGSEGSLDSSQVSRGFGLVVRQAEEKRANHAAATSKLFDVVIGFSTLAAKMEELLRGNLGRLMSGDDEEERLAGDTIANEVKRCMAEIQSYFASGGSLDKVRAPSSPHTESEEMCEQPIKVYEGVNCSNRVPINRASLNGPECWVVSSNTPTPYVDITLPDSELLSSVCLQGGIIPTSMQPETTPASSDTRGVTLPCGVGLVSCDGSVECTVKALGDIISWEALIKKNPPEKFLKRPPVRFMFDLICLVSRECRLSIDSKEDLTNWEVVGASKQSKMQFMDAILSFVSEYLHMPAATSASAIVAGMDCELTNLFLQHLAVVAYCNKEGIPLGTSLLPPPQLSPRAAEKVEGKDGTGEAWVSAVRVEWSADGVAYNGTDEVNLNLNQAHDIQKIVISTVDRRSAARARYIRINALRWEGNVACLRFGINCWRSSGGAGEITASSEVNVEPEVILSALALLRQTAESVAQSTNHLHTASERDASKKQEEVRKRMENLADEKMALEQKLASEKLALSTEKQGLEEQLREALTKLHEVEGLLSKERTLRAQLEELHASVSNENRSLQHSLKEQVEEKAGLQTELLMYQANSERDSKLVESLRRRVEEEEGRVSRLEEEVETARAQQCEWESEKEDLVNQIEVLTEERDSARQNEEELFEELRERTNDLEKLQESYVNMTDRCNDYQDEISDMREAMEGLKEAALADHRQFLSAAPPVSEPPVEHTSTAECNGQRSVDEKPQPSDPPEIGEADSYNYSFDAAEPTEGPTKLETEPVVQEPQAVPNAGSPVGDDAEDYYDDNFEDEFEDDFED